MISYDPDSAPQIDAETFERGTKLGLHPIHVVCDEPGDKSDWEGVSFIAFASFIPRIGELLSLEDGTNCRVTDVFYKLGRHQGTKVVQLVANVYAQRVPLETD